MTKLLIVASITMLAHAQEDLILRLQTGNVPGNLVIPAQTEASKILAQAGVRVHWKFTDDRGEARRPVRECNTKAPDVSVIDIFIQDQSVVQEHQGALGYSLPFAKTGFRVVIFFDRVTAAAGRPSPKLLGHVIAHEVGHMLIGTSSHSPEGVMRARWTGRQMSVLQLHPLQFTPGDIDFIARRFTRQRVACAGTELSE